MNFNDELPPLPCGGCTGSGWIALTLQTGRVLPVTNYFCLHVWPIKGKIMIVQYVDLILKTCRRHWLAVGAGSAFSALAGNEPSSSSSLIGGSCAQSAIRAVEAVNKSFTRWKELSNVLRRPRCHIQILSPKTNTRTENVYAMCSGSKMSCNQQANLVSVTLVWRIAWKIWQTE